MKFQITRPREKLYCNWVIMLVTMATPISSHLKDKNSIFTARGEDMIFLVIFLYTHIYTALMRPRRPKQYCLQLNIALWCKNQIEHCIWDESLLLCHCACSLEYFSLSTLAGLSYHICGKLKVAFKASPSSQHLY